MCHAQTHMNFRCMCYIFFFQSTIIGLDNTILEQIIVNILWKKYLYPRMLRFKAVRRLERNIKLLKIVILLFLALDFISAPFFYPVLKQWGF